jgi:hypothetical protein
VDAPHDHCADLDRVPAPVVHLEDGRGEVLRTQRQALPDAQRVGPVEPRVAGGTGIAAEEDHDRRFVGLQGKAAADAKQAESDQREPGGERTGVRLWQAGAEKERAEGQQRDGDQDGDPAIDRLGIRLDLRKFIIHCERLNSMLFGSAQSKRGAMCMPFHTS